jgi:hypothetical protein
MVTDRAVDYVELQDHAKPFFLCVSYAFAHHPALANTDFSGKSPGGEYGDSLLEHDYNVGRILDALEKACLADWSAAPSDAVSIAIYLFRSSSMKRSTASSMASRG